MSRVPPTPADAYFNQRQAIAACSSRLRRLREAISDPTNLSSFQWAQWFAYVREYRPDVVLELGRGKGNSTAVVAEALFQSGHGRLVSFCLSRTWHTQTVPLLAPLVEPDWFSRLEIRTGNLLHEDFHAVLGDARRVLVVWDAHGYEIAALVLGHLLPLLEGREHVVLMHDISDSRYLGANALSYAGRELWQGMAWAYAGGHQESRLCLGWINTIVEQPVAVLDFLTRNGGELQSADHSLHEDLGRDAERRSAMEETLHAEDWSLLAHWAYFSLNGLRGPLTFPRFVRPALARQASAGLEEPLEIAATRTLDLVKIVGRRALRQLRKQP